MESTNTSTIDQFDGVKKITDETAIGILIKDLISSSKIQSEEGKKLLLRLIKVLEEKYLEREREIMTKFAFDFYSELSDDMNVPDSLVSENSTSAKIYFDEKFNKSK